MEFLLSNYSWMRKNDSLSQKNGLEYILNDKDFKNKTYTHYYQALNYTSVLVRYRAEALGLFLKLKLIREDADANTIRNIMVNLELQPF
jgi:hypothetical protein